MSIPSEKARCCVTLVSKHCLTSGISHVTVRKHIFELELEHYLGHLHCVHIREQPFDSYGGR